MCKDHTLKTPVALKMESLSLFVALNVVQIQSFNFSIVTNNENAVETLKMYINVWKWLWGV